MTTPSTSTTPADLGRDTPLKLELPDSLRIVLVDRAKRNRRTAAAEAIVLIERGMLVANPVDFPASADAQERRRAEQVAKQVIDGCMDVERLHADAAKAEGSATVDQLLAAAFAGPRSPRSPEYRAGVRAVLEFRITGAPIHRLYAAGTAQDDAFDAGQVEGHAVWRRAIAKGAA